MSEIDEAIQGLREAEILQQQRTQVDNKYIISNNTLNQSIQAIQQAREQLQLYKDFLRKVVDVTDNNKFGLIKIMAAKLLKMQNEY